VVPVFFAASESRCVVVRDIAGHAATTRSIADERRARSIAQRIAASFGGSINSECSKNDWARIVWLEISPARAGGVGQARLPIQRVRGSAE